MIPRISMRAFYTGLVLFLSIPGVFGGYVYTWNRNYFNFPPLTDWIPVFQVGDTVNVSWSTEWNSRNINVWCGPGFSLSMSHTSLLHQPISN
jgi:hypothetical protein